MAVDKSSPPPQKDQWFCKAECEASAAFMVFTKALDVKRTNKSVGTLVSARMISVSNDHTELIHVFYWGEHAKAVFWKVTILECLFRKIDLAKASSCFFCGCWAVYRNRAGGDEAEEGSVGLVLPLQGKACCHLAAAQPGLAQVVWDSLLHAGFFLLKRELQPDDI